MKKTTRPSIAFALGGLAGNNAHGAGFLHGALRHKRHDLTPTMISCSSGQIYWVWQYLQARGAPADRDRVEREFMADIQAVHRIGNINLDYGAIACQGLPHIFRPAFDITQPFVNQYTIDLWRNAVLAALHILSEPLKTFWAQEILRAFPGRLLIPLRPDDVFKQISKAFIDEPDIGIAFNAYCPANGTEYVYLNDAARRQLAPDGPKYRHGYISPSRSFPREATSAGPNRTIYQNITAEAVREALWLYEYGFEQRPDQSAKPQCVDGAYYRQIMLKELQCADIIFVARPINACWQADREREDGQIGGAHQLASAPHSREARELPRSYIEIQDLKTEVAFNGSYVGERAQIALINALVEKCAAAVDAGILAKDCPLLRGYKRIDLVEIEIQGQRGFFDYIFESPDVFAQAGDALERKLLEPDVRALLG